MKWQKSFGHVGVIDNKKQLIGIITDGDIRRNINKQFLNIMLVQLCLLSPSWSARLKIDALSIMNNNKITCLFVVEKTKEKFLLVCIFMIVWDMQIRFQNIQFYVLVFILLTSSVALTESNKLEIEL